MKTIPLVLLLLLTHVGLIQPGLAQPQKGEPVGNLSFSTLLNAPKKAITLDELRGKIVLIEFWATWCAPCVEAMPHLSALQRRHADKLQIITVSDESPARIGKYLTARPATPWFAVDTAHALTQTFPHHVIPHSVLIAPDGRLLAQTEPRAITDQVIDSLWRQQVVHLPEKTDNSLTVPEILTTYFKAADSVTSRFVIQGEIKGAPGMRTNHLNEVAFRHRRITALNLSLASLYRIAHNDFPYRRTIDRTGSTDRSPTYCLDLITSTPDRLLPTMQQELASRFDMQARIEPQAKDVNVLRITDLAKFDQIPRNQSGQRTYSGRQGEIDQQAVTMTDFAEYLETYGPGKRIVVDETGREDLLDIRFSYQPEDPKSLPAVLSAMGLSLEKEQHTVDMLILYIHREG